MGLTGSNVSDAAFQTCHLIGRPPVHGRPVTDLSELVPAPAFRRPVNNRARVISHVGQVRYVAFRSNNGNGYQGAVFTTMAEAAVLALPPTQGGSVINHTGMGRISTNNGSGIGYSLNLDRN